MDKFYSTLALKKEPLYLEKNPIEVVATSCFDMTMRLIELYYIGEINLVEIFLQNRISMLDYRFMKNRVISTLNFNIDAVTSQSIIALKLGLHSLDFQNDKTKLLSMVFEASSLISLLIRLSMGKFIKTNVQNSLLDPEVLSIAALTTTLAIFLTNSKLGCTSNIEMNRT
jgi:hypothetical protein